MTIRLPKNFSCENVHCNKFLNYNNQWLRYNSYEAYIFFILLFLSKTHFITNELTSTNTITSMVPTYLLRTVFFLLISQMMYHSPLVLLTVKNNDPNGIRNNLIIWRAWMSYLIELNFLLHFFKDMKNIAVWIIN